MVKQDIWDIGDGSHTQQAARELGVPDIDLELLETALTHTTAANVLGVESFQRLEFLGDAVLELCVSRTLFDRHPDWQEGELTKRRIEFVRKTTLSAIAVRFNLHKYIKVAPAEKYIVQPDNPKVMADALEAVIAAIYLSCGLDRAGAFIENMLDNYTPIISDAARNWKSDLQEAIMRGSGGNPRYEIVRTRGPIHAPSFDAVCVLGRKILGRGTGNNKKEAERNAARAAFSLYMAESEQSGESAFYVAESIQTNESTIKQPEQVE